MASLTTHFLKAFLPPDLVDYIDVNVLHPQGPVQAWKREAVTQAQRGFDTAYPLVQPLLDRLLRAMAENQGLVGIAVVLTVITVVLVVLNWIRRLMLWCTRLTLRVAFWGLLALVVSWAWERGPLQSMQDAVVVGSKIVGYLAALKNVWLSEYDRYEGQQNMAGARGRGSGR